MLWSKNATYISAPSSFSARQPDKQCPAPDFFSSFNDEMGFFARKMKQIPSIRRYYYIICCVFWIENASFFPSQCFPWNLISYEEKIKCSLTWWIHSMDSIFLISFTFSCFCIMASGHLSRQMIFDNVCLEQTTTKSVLPHEIQLTSVIKWMLSCY